MGEVQACSLEESDVQGLQKVRKVSGTESSTNLGVSRKAASAAFPRELCRPFVYRLSVASVEHL